MKMPAPKMLAREMRSIWAMRGPTGSKWPEPRGGVMNELLKKEGGCACCLRTL